MSVTVVDLRDVDPTLRAEDALDVALDRLHAHRSAMVEPHAFVLTHALERTLARAAFVDDDDPGRLTTICGLEVWVGPDRERP